MHETLIISSVFFALHKCNGHVWMWTLIISSVFFVLHKCNGHVWMWELDYKESWGPKNWYLWTVVLEKTLESPWTARRSIQSILKEISPGCSLEGMILKLKLPIFWPPDAKSWLIWKDPDTGKYWGQEEKGMTEDEMVGWHHRLDGHGFGHIPGVGDGQEGLACCGSWGCKESDTTERLNWTEWQPTPVFLPGKFYEQKSLVDHSPKGHRFRHDWTTTQCSTIWLLN